MGGKYGLGHSRASFGMVVVGRAESSDHEGSMPRRTKHVIGGGIVLTYVISCQSPADHLVVGLDRHDTCPDGIGLSTIPELAIDCFAAGGIAAFSARIVYIFTALFIALQRVRTIQVIICWYTYLQASSGTTLASHVLLDRVCKIDGALLCRAQSTRMLQVTVLLSTPVLEVLEAYILLIGFDASAFRSDHLACYDLA